jgi:tRNA threonylcarbamoyladenosine biosynthesis protein TsaB
VTSRIVAIDTTSEFGSLALLADGSLVEEVAMDSADGFGHVLFSRLEALLARHGTGFGDVTCFAAAAGPGSFTGIRVGLAAVKGLGAALGKPVVGVSNLQALAWHGSAPLRAVFLDARRGEVYGGLYSDTLAVVQPESVTGLSEWLGSLPAVELEFISTDLTPLAGVTLASPLASAPKRTAPRRLAAAVGFIAAGKLAGGLGADPSTLEANYVRRSDAELFWREW